MSYDRMSLVSREKYTNELFGHEDSHLKRIYQSMQEGDKKGMHISANEGQILSLLIKISGAKKILEIGLLYGYSTLYMARALPKDGLITSLEVSPLNIKAAKENLSLTEVYDKIKIIEGDALETLPHLKTSYDMVFIDANKSSYEKYLDWAEENIKKGGIIIGDNSYLFGYVYGEGHESFDFRESTLATMINFNRRLADPSRYQSCMIPTGEGMSVGVKLF